MAAWKCSLDDRDDTVATLGLWAPGTLLRMARRKKPLTLENFKAEVEAEFGPYAAEHFAEKAFNIGVDHVAQLTKLVPVLETMAQNNKVGGDNNHTEMVKAPEHPGLNMREDVPGRPRMINKAHAIGAAHRLLKRGVETLWRNGSASVHVGRLLSTPSKATTHWSPLHGDVIEWAQGLPKGVVGYTVRLPVRAARVKYDANRVSHTVEGRKVIESFGELLRDPRIGLEVSFDAKKGAHVFRPVLFTEGRRNAKKFAAEFDMPYIVNGRNAKVELLNEAAKGRTRDFSLSEIESSPRPRITKRGAMSKSKMWRDIQVADALLVEAEAVGVGQAEYLVNTAKEIREEVMKRPKEFANGLALPAIEAAAQMENRAARIQSGGASENAEFWQTSMSDPSGSTRHYPNNRGSDSARLRTVIDRNQNAAKSAEPKLTVEGLEAAFAELGEFRFHVRNMVDKAIAQTATGVSPASKEAISLYISDLAIWEMTGRQGAAPKPPASVEAKGLFAEHFGSAVEMLGDIVHAAKPDWKAAVDSAVHKMPTDSAAAKLLRSDIAPLFQEVTAMLAEKAIRIPPDASMKTGHERSVRNAMKAEEIEIRKENDDLRSEIERDIPAGLLGDKITMKTMFDDIADALVVDLPKAHLWQQAGAKAVKGFLEMIPAGASGSADVELAAKAGFEWGPVGLWDYIRPHNQFTFRKALPGELGTMLGDMIRERGIQASARRHTVDNWMRQEMYDLNEYMRTIKPEARETIQKQIIDIVEGEMSMPVEMHPGAKRAVSAIKSILGDYKMALEAMGKKTRKEYFPHIFEHLFRENANDRFATSRLKEVRSRFMNPRKTKSKQFMTDLNDVMNMYINSVERVLTWDPVMKAWDGIKAHAKKQGSPIPDKVERYFNSYFDVLLGKPGSLDRFTNFVAQAMIEGGAAVAQKVPVVGRFVKDPSPQAAKKLIRGWMSANYLGALGGSIISPMKNLTANLQTLSQIGLDNWIWGFKNMTAYDPATGRAKFNPLLERLGIFEDSLTRDIKNDANTFRGKMKGLHDDVSNTLMAMFDATEVQLRATAALGAMRAELLKKNIKPETATDAQIDAAVKVGRDAQARTQAEYSQYMGGIMFGSDTGKALFQFGRFGFHYMDLLQLSVRAMTPGKLGASARKMMPQFMDNTGYNRVITGVMLMAGMMGLQNLFSEMGIFVGDLSGAGGGVPEVAKGAVGVAVEGVAAIATDNPIGARKMSDKVNTFIGTTTRDTNPWATLAASFGPLPSQAFSMANLIGNSTRPEQRALAWNDFKRSFQTIMPAGLQYQRVKRLLEESERGYVVSSVVGDKIWPSARKMQPFEHIRRLVGTTPASLAEEYRALSGMVRDKGLYNRLTNDLKLETFEAMDRGTTREKAIADYMLRYDEIASYFGQYQSNKKVLQRAARVMKEYDEERYRSRRARRSEQFPFNAE